MVRMETVNDLIDEAKVRTLYWAICIFAIAYFLSHTSKSMWTNIPISILILSAFRFLSYELELRWRVRPVLKQTYLSHLQRQQLSVNDSRLSTVPTISKWKRKIDSPAVEAAINDFIDKILQDFVVNLWYSSITPDKEAPELIRVIILDALGEISGRIKEVNLVDLITRDMVDLIGNHLELYRKNQLEIGKDVMGTLSSEERDERLKHHLMASKELHPALISPECEYKVLQRIVGGVLSIVLKPREAQCPLVRCFSREFLTCLVMQPVMNFANPEYINELIEYLFLTNNDNKSEEISSNRSSATTNQHSVHAGNIHSSCPDLKKEATSQKSTSLTSDGKTSLFNSGPHLPAAAQESSTHDEQYRSADWAIILEAATKRRSQVLAPENLENMWTKGRNYQKKSAKLIRSETSSAFTGASHATSSSTTYRESTGNETSTQLNERATCVEDDRSHHPLSKPKFGTLSPLSTGREAHISQNLVSGQAILEGHFEYGSATIAREHIKGKNEHLKRSSSTPDIDMAVADKSCAHLALKEFYSSDVIFNRAGPSAELVTHREDSTNVPKIKCRVVGAYFEKLGSKSFAVYSIAVTDAENKTWFVKRRYRNFERLHRHLKDISNYTLHLPPKRFLSSSIDDYFVHQRCILLDKYLQDLLSIANVAEQYELWDFLSFSSKNYSFGKSTSVMKTLAVNMDDAMDDIVRQFKGVSDGIRRKVVGPSTSPVLHPITSERTFALPWHDEETIKQSPSHSNMESSHSLSDVEDHEEDHSSKPISGWHSDNELNSKGFPPRVIKNIDQIDNFDSHRSQQYDKYEASSSGMYLQTKNSLPSSLLEGLSGVPPGWMPANVSVPLLNLVDIVFQLNRRGWLRRQVFWISKQILQLVMEDAIDDWILRQIHWLRNEEVIALGIRWVQDVLWPDGVFYIKLGSDQGKLDDLYFIQAQLSRRTSCDKSSFEQQFEATRRASEVKKMLLGGTPAALVSLIGQKQYRRCARDIYYFIQSTVCLKQLAYSMLELVLISVFPELRDLIRDIHQKTHA